MKDLPHLITETPRDIEALADYFDALVRRAAEEVNVHFSPRRLSKGTRSSEPLPVDKRQLSSYRTRIGTMLEYALSTSVDGMLKAEFGDAYRLTFAVAHEYPDFYFRDQSLSRLLRIEMKAVDAESDEQAARFGVPTVHIEPKDDLLLLVGWQWAIISDRQVEVGEYPHIFTTLVVPAQAIVEERDLRLGLSGGEIRGEEVYVPKRGKPGDFVLDPGNYGKLWRLLHGSRRDSESLSPSVQRFLEFLREVNERSPRDRFGS